MFSLRKKNVSYTLFQKFDYKFVLCILSIDLTFIYNKFLLILIALREAIKFSSVQLPIGVSSFKHIFVYRLSVLRYVFFKFTRFQVQIIRPIFML
jgi:hypothetical protein